MTPAGVTFEGPPVDDGEVLDRLPADLADLLRGRNGFVAYHGGLHVRGACLKPLWHALREAWLGPNALHRHYPGLTADDVPFAQDCVGDQFLIRAGQVWKLSAETGDLDPVARTVADFLREADADPIEYLSLDLLNQFRADGGVLKPGQLLSVYPPFCLAGEDDRIDLRAIPADDRLGFLADFARQIRDIPDGGRIEIKLV